MLHGEDEFNAKKRSKFQKRLKEIEGFEIEIQQELMKFHIEKEKIFKQLQKMNSQFFDKITKGTDGKHVRA